jgi:hypothetical protein
MSMLAKGYDSKYNEIAQERESKVQLSVAVQAKARDEGKLLLDEVKSGYELVSKKYEAFL